MKVKLTAAKKSQIQRETLTPGEAAQILGIRPQHVRELCKVGQISAIWSGRNIHIPRIALDEFMLRGGGKI